MMKALVSTALMLIFWSIINEMQGETISMLCFPPSESTWSNTYSRVPNAILQEWSVLIQVNFDTILELGQKQRVGTLSQVGAL